jgi:HNH endonuclease
MDDASPRILPRRRSSLEGFIDFSIQPLFSSAEERARAKDEFDRIVNHFGGATCIPLIINPTTNNTNNTNSDNDEYNRPLLIRLTYEYACSEESQDMFLQAFFKSMALSMNGDSPDLHDIEVEEELRSVLFGFADYLLDKFFLPLRACSGKTPQLTPVYHAAMQRDETPERTSTLGELRGSCLVRDRHRCVITRQFDRSEAKARIKEHGANAKNDEENLLSNETQFDYLEVAHILPHSLTQTGSNSQLVSCSLFNSFSFCLCLCLV